MGASICRTQQRRAPCDAAVNPWKPVRGGRCQPALEGSQPAGGSGEQLGARGGCRGRWAAGADAPAFCAANAWRRADRSRAPATDASRTRVAPADAPAAGTQRHRKAKRAATRTPADFDRRCSCHCAERELLGRTDCQQQQQQRPPATTSVRGPAADTRAADTRDAPARGRGRGACAATRWRGSDAPWLVGAAFRTRRPRRARRRGPRCRAAGSGTSWRRTRGARAALGSPETTPLATW